MRMIKSLNLTERKQCLIYYNHEVTICHLPNYISPLVPPSVVACYFVIQVIHGSSATLKAEFRKAWVSIPVGGNSVMIGVWIV